MPSEGIVEPVDVSGDGVVMAISLATYGDHDAALPKFSLVVDIEVLAAAITVMDQTWMRIPNSESTAECVDRHAALQAITLGRTHDPSEADVEDHT